MGHGLLRPDTELAQQIHIEVGSPQSVEPVTDSATSLTVGHSDSTARRVRWSHAGHRMNGRDDEGTAGAQHPMHLAQHPRQIVVVVESAVGDDQIDR